VELSAGGLASFGGLVSAPEITVASGDINIATGASVGNAGVTQVVNLLAVSDSPVVIGDLGTAPAAGSYVLNEDGDIVAGTVNFTAQAKGGGSDPDVLVGEFQIGGSQTIGGGIAHVNVETGGNVVVSGALDYTNAAAGDTFAITAGETIQVVTNSGHIAMTDSADKLSGSLDLTAHDIWVAEQALIDKLNADPNFAGRDAALATNNGTNNPAGYVGAGGVTVTMLGSSLFVQNSGTAAQPGGISVGDGGLTVINNGTTAAPVTVFGQQVKSDGTVNSGNAFFGAVEFGGSGGGFNNASTVNGCSVGAGCIVTPPPVDPPPVDPPVDPVPPINTGVESILGPIGLMDGPTELGSIEDEFANGESQAGEGSDEEEDGEESEDDGADGSVGLINTGPVSLELPIDDPVTSGNDGPVGN
jgi:hypothetical protein